MTTRHIALAIAGLFLALPFTLGTIHAASHGTKVDNLEITGVWARATPPRAKNGGAFLTVTNHGMVADKLIAASTEMAKKTELHNHINDNGIMRMRHVPHVEVPAHGQAVLKPGSYHVMMMGLKGPLREGEMLMVKLTFKKAGTVMVHMPIMKGTAMPKGVKMQHKHN